MILGLLLGGAALLAGGMVIDAVSKDPELSKAFGDLAKDIVDGLNEFADEANKMEKDMNRLRDDYNKGKVSKEHAIKEIKKNQNKIKNDVKNHLK